MEASFVILNAGDLRFRAAARSDRARLLTCLAELGFATLDVSRVDAMSEDYADELLGVLTHYFGASWVLRRIAVLGAHESIMHTIAAAICQREKLRRRQPAIRRLSNPRRSEPLVHH